jgi:hypothetical protein
MFCVRERESLTAKIRKQSLVGSSFFPLLLVDDMFDCIVVVVVVVEMHIQYNLSMRKVCIQESIIPNFVFLRFPIFAVKLECL